jgi:hypothetical protein
MLDPEFTTDGTVERVIKRPGVLPGHIEDSGAP